MLKKKKLKRLNLTKQTLNQSKFWEKVARDKYLLAQ